LPPAFAATDVAALTDTLATTLTGAFAAALTTRLTVRDKTDQVFGTFYLIKHFSTRDCLILIIQLEVAAHQSWLLNDVTMMSFAPLVVELCPYLSSTLT
jgi:hypothetical protein